MDRQVKNHVRFNSSILSSSDDDFEPSSSNAKQRSTLVEWLNNVLPDLSLPINSSDEELRGFLIDGTVLCRILNKLKPGSVTEFNGSAHSSHSPTGNVQKFLSAMDETGLPRFQAIDLEKGSMKVDCLLMLQMQFTPNVKRSNGTDASKRWKFIGKRVGSREGSPRKDPFLSLSLSSPTSEERRRVLLSDTKFQWALNSPTMADSLAALINHGGHKFHEVFQLKHGSYTDLSPGKLSEMMKSNSLDD